MTKNPPPTEHEILTFRAAELRMVAGIFEANGDHERAEVARENALFLDPPAGRC